MYTLGESRMFFPKVKCNGDLLPHKLNRALRIGTRIDLTSPKWTKASIEPKQVSATFPELLVIISFMATLLLAMMFFIATWL